MGSKLNLHPFGRRLKKTPVIFITTCPDPLSLGALRVAQRRGVPDLTPGNKFCRGVLPGFIPIKLEFYTNGHPTKYKCLMALRLLY
jgi:hypothetical protein